MRTSKGAAFTVARKTNPTGVAGVKPLYANNELTTTNRTHSKYLGDRRIRGYRAQWTHGKRTLFRDFTFRVHGEYALAVATAYRALATKFMRKVKTR